ncbi:MAG: glutamine--scyllo-inositol aminotransferase [Cyclobacteriaceae bacterium]|nr:MAG: glutamine--scyllo-inositol aminotransferase [Cyclobacteriaceae bacterium]
MCNLSKKKRISSVDLRSQYYGIKSEIDQAIQQVLEDGVFAQGPNVNEFEKEFAMLHGIKYCTAVASGTAALHILLRALEIGPGDEVIVPVNGCFVTSETISIAGARPVFVDCTSDYFNLDPKLIDQAITPRTKAILVVHLYGQPAQMTEIVELVNKYGLILLEDCAQAHLAKYHDTPVGNFGKAGAISFYPTKNLGAYGESGAIITNDEEIYRKTKILRNHGLTTKYRHSMVGYNYRMDNIQASILRVKLKHLIEWTDIRRKLATYYTTCLEKINEVIVPQVQPFAEHVFHQYVVQVKERQKLMDHLEQCGVTTSIHYPIPCHLQPAFKPLGYKSGRFPIAESCAQSVLSLPLSEQLKPDDIKYVSECIANYYS